MEEVPLSLLDDNPFNVRTTYDATSINELSGTMRQNGLLCPIMVRRTEQGRFQLVHGHRRARAGRLLGWTSISAQVVDISDEQMLTSALLENISREDISDYEKALAFRRLIDDFGKTYEEVGRIAGYSKSHVGNYLAMLNLFDDDTLGKNPQLRNHVQSISEHHARVLLRVKDTETRISLLKLVVTEGYSVRELQRVVNTFRSWFGAGNERGEVVFDPSMRNVAQSSSQADNHWKNPEVTKIHSILELEFKHAGGADVHSFMRIHAFSNGFSMFDDFPPYHRCLQDTALEKEKNWFYAIGPHLTVKIRDLNVRFYEHVAVATFYADYRTRKDGKEIIMSSRGTVVFLREHENWKIVHEHLSNIEQWKAVPTELIEYLKLH